jgi:hypothetical protein
MRESSIPLPARVELGEVADASRHAIRAFLAIEADERSLSGWLAGPYRKATGFSPRQVRGQHLREAATLGGPGADTESLVTAAKTMVIAALAAAERANSDLLALLPPIVHVAPAHDAQGNRGFIPVDEANMRLVDRVLALLVVDCLSRRRPVQVSPYPVH